MTLPRSAADVLADHVVWELECIDRMYLNLYVLHPNHVRLELADHLLHLVEQPGELVTPGCARARHDQLLLLDRLRGVALEERVANRRLAADHAEGLHTTIVRTPKEWLEPRRWHSAVSSPAVELLDQIDGSVACIRRGRSSNLQNCWTETP